MKKNEKLEFRHQRGQALIIVLAMLTFCGLTITPGLSFVVTKLNNTSSIHHDINGMYAADAGIEKVIWCLENGAELPTILDKELNGMNVSLSTVNQGYLTMYMGMLINPKVHQSYLQVLSEIEWEESLQVYRYTVQTTKVAGSTVIHLNGIGARLPAGFTYIENSAASFPANLSRNEPTINYDNKGVQMVHWDFSPPLPSLSDSNPESTQVLYLQGNGDVAGYYSWVIANRADVGQVGEINGISYTITATARNSADNSVAALVVANIMLINGSAQIVSWEIMK